MKEFVVLAAVYNHRHEWQENLAELLFMQDYAGPVQMVLIDDRDPDRRYPMNIQIYKKNRSVTTLFLDKRAPSLAAKYDIAYKQVSKFLDPHYVCVWDDDDLYLPQYLSKHAEVLQDHMWSYPARVWTTPGGMLRQEDAIGNFWTSSAYRSEAVEGIGGYGEEEKLIFDQDFMHRLHKTYGKPGIPSDPPQYVYNWDICMDNHVSGDVSDNWYKCCPQSKAKDTFTPQLNEISQGVLNQIEFNNERQS